MHKPERRAANSGTHDDPDDARDARSTAHIRTRDTQSLEQWAAALGVTVDALQSAMLAVGTRVDRIKDYLTGGMAAEQVDA